jgi:LysM repeat protein
MASPVYLTGTRAFNCLRQYSFRLEPVQTESSRADVEVIPGIGIISDRTGRNGVEMEQNVYRLLKINGMSLDNYIYNFCQSRSRPGYNDRSFITGLPQNPGAPTGGYDPYDPFNEPDKEGYNPIPNTPGGNQVNCPEKPGYGYHLVQPGESLHYIARLYNLEAKSLIAWNNITDPNRIEVCDKLWLSPQTGTNTPTAQPGNYHVVQKGETLVGIARKYNLTEAAIRNLNGLPASGNVVIQPGQRIVIFKSITPTTTGNKPAHTQAPPQNTSFIPIGRSADKETNTSGTPITTPPSGPGGRMQYKVPKGETLVSVAQRFGYTAHYLRHINRNTRNLPYSDDDLLTEGTVLLVSDTKERLDLASYTPPPASAAPYFGGRKSTIAPDPVAPQRFEFVGEYIVKTGDTLRSIAQQYGLTVEKLAAANNLRPGQEPQARDIVKIPR